MAYITLGQARARSRAQWSNSTLAESAIRKSASTSMSTIFDIFLSHSFEDAELIAGVKGFIEDQGLQVYVDWIEDAQADRSYVTAATAEMLRQRMDHCQMLLYVSSDAAKKSKWMPWELGYFDGRKPGYVGIVPVVAWEGKTFQGQEYLGLYPYVELINFKEKGIQLAKDIDESTALPLRVAVRKSFL